MSYERVNHYFKQLNDLFLKHHYRANAIYNMDEPGFSLGSTGNNKVIVSQVTRKELRKFKKIPGRQEWITSIECIGASGVTLHPALFLRLNTSIQAGYQTKHLQTGCTPPLIVVGRRIH